MGVKLLSSVLGLLFLLFSLALDWESGPVLFHEIPDPETGLNFTSIASRSWIERGTTHLFPEKSVHGAIIMSEAAFNPLPKNMTALSLDQLNYLRRITARIYNYRLLQHDLPFRLSRWSGMSGLPCPQHPEGHRTERGLLYAHFRIWKEFVYFDEDLLSQLSRHNGTIPTDVLASRDKVFKIYSNGTMTKQGIPFKDDDVLVIFEDDAENCITDLPVTITEELKAMHGIDVLYLGWCDGKNARPHPLCAHAYAITRASARKLIKYFEPCGKALDEQLLLMIQHKWITYRRAFPYSHKTNLKPTCDNSGNIHRHKDKTFGIFRQNKLVLGSINGNMNYDVANLQRIKQAIEEMAS